VIAKKRFEMLPCHPVKMLSAISRTDGISLSRPLPLISIHLQMFSFWVFTNNAAVGYYAAGEAIAKAVRDFCPIRRLILVNRL
jgi:hypothetical protein